ncbi:hypothetical protein FB566_2305 [Stackebrandtia endophytica]|uniref:Uncharacterized protein n=1 Tax=Stackebrandtia endophytica TaxID=1496996 RepID=A0A543AW04_9ACTN|nr:hypothetical protein [Stackebrandtia endophytica]TQL76768.1 hypothetical protein FB566_2305 [Stackebrandtia endophytica]
MSSDNEFDPADGARHGARRRRPISWINTVLILTCAIGALVSFVAGHPSLGAALLAGGLAGGIGAKLARRPGAGDFERVNALEYADERERAAGVKGLAVVGATAMILTFGQMVVVTVRPDVTVAGMWPFAMLLILAAVWTAANWYFVRRG